METPAWPLAALRWGLAAFPAGWDPLRATSPSRACCARFNAWLLARSLLAAPAPATSRAVLQCFLLEGWLPLGCPGSPSLQPGERVGISTWDAGMPKPPFSQGSSGWGLMGLVHKASRIWEAAPPAGLQAFRRGTSCLWQMGMF